MMFSYLRLIWKFKTPEWLILIGGCFFTLVLAVSAILGGGHTVAHRVFGGGLVVTGSVWPYSRLSRKSAGDFGWLVLTFALTTGFFAAGYGDFSTSLFEPFSAIATPAPALVSCLS